MTVAGGVPKVDPLARRGAAMRAFMGVMRTNPGRWFSINIVARVDPHLMRASHGRVGFGMTLPSANLTTTGAKSGEPRTATILYFTDGDDVILIASSFGRDKHPAWYHNLKAHPEATLECAGQSGRYTATEVDDEGERTRLFELSDHVYPGYADYRVRAGAIGRRIPIMRLRLSQEAVS
jgi:deazaflavin-dependent oxidoreductase (nitroreductase family)